MADESGAPGGMPGGVGGPAADVQGAGTRARSNPAPKPLREAWTHRFIAKLAEFYGDATAAARAVKRDRSTVYERRDADPDFRAAWDLVRAGHDDALERCMARRAIEGDRRVRTMRNGELEETIEFDTALQIYMARVRLKDRGYNISPSDTGVGATAAQLAAALRGELGAMAASVPAAPATPEPPKAT